MPTWLEKVRTELEKLDPASLLEPMIEMDAKDHAVGEVNDTDLRRLFGLAMQLQKDALASLLEARYANNPGHQKHCAEKAKELQHKSKILMDIFWISIRELFGLWRKPSIGIRRGWKIIWNEPPEEIPVQVIGAIASLVDAECNCPTCAARRFGADPSAVN